MSKVFRPRALSGILAQKQGPSGLPRQFVSCQENVFHALTARARNVNKNGPKKLRIHREILWTNGPEGQDVSNADRFSGRDETIIIEPFPLLQQLPDEGVDYQAIFLVD